MVGMSGTPAYEELQQRVRELEKEAARLKAVEAGLRASEEKLTQIIQGNSIPTLVIDQRHTVTHCNRAYETLTGIPADQLIGTRNQWIAFYPAQRNILADFVVDQVGVTAVERYYKGSLTKFSVVHGSYQAEGYFPHMRGGGRWIFITAAPLLDTQGHITGAIETFQDLTERKTAEETLRKSERRYRSLLEFLPYPVVVYSRRGRVSFVNSEFTKTFGWTLDEVLDRPIPYFPSRLEHETEAALTRLFEEKLSVAVKSKRLTKDGRILDVAIKAAPYIEAEQDTTEVIAILRDISQEVKNARTNETMLRISLALPQYPDLDALLFYINTEVKRLLGTEGSLVVLLDEEKNELYFIGAVYEDQGAQRRAKQIRFPADKGIAGRVIQTGKPVIVKDTYKDPDFVTSVDEQLGYRSTNLMFMPLRTRDRTIGALGAVNKKEAPFDESDVDLLTVIEGTVALSVENAAITEKLRQSYEAVKSLNKAKDKMINHLSHEMKTPLAVLAGAVNLIKKKVTPDPSTSWHSLLEMTERNLLRLRDIQYEAEDIMLDRSYRPRAVLSSLLDVCSDELRVLLRLEGASEAVVEGVQAKIDEFFGPKELSWDDIRLDVFVRTRLEALRPEFGHRELEVSHELAEVPPIFLPREVLRTVVDCLIKNAVEATPDQGKIEVCVRPRGSDVELEVHDYGVGITGEAQERIFEGFFTPEDTLEYSSRRPFDFGAGGKGADLLRAKIFSERYDFNIWMESTRCRFIPGDNDRCPGRIEDCTFCENRTTCYGSGGTQFFVVFPAASRVPETGQ
jgi:PAS domain S-box-containing protein